MFALLVVSFSQTHVVAFYVCAVYTPKLRGKGDEVFEAPIPVFAKQGGEVPTVESAINDKSQFRMYNYIKKLATTLAGVLMILKMVSIYSGWGLMATFRIEL